MLTIDPSFDLGKWRNLFIYRDPVLLNQEVADLAKLGLGEIDELSMAIRYRNLPELPNAEIDLIVENIEVCRDGGARSTSDQRPLLPAKIDKALSAIDPGYTGDLLRPEGQTRLRLLDPAKMPRPPGSA